MSHALRALFTVAAAFAFALPASAQESQQTPPTHGMTAVSGAVAVSGPLKATSVFPVATAADAFRVAPMPRAPTRQNKALMIVGGAGLLVGAIVGGDEGSLIMIAGGGIGLLGLYQYLR